jgi:GAF domain-containing protein
VGEGLHRLDDRESPLAVSFCARAIGSDDALVVPDAQLDPRFAQMAVVTGPPHLRFYAGHPIATAGASASARCASPGRSRAG